MKRYPTKVFTVGQVAAALESKNIRFELQGQQINADLVGSGHCSTKITPRRGLYLDVSTGTGDTVARLLREIHADIPHVSHAESPMEIVEDNGKKALDLWHASWTCTYATDMPSGWDRGLNVRQKGSSRAKFERNRDAVRVYIACRLGPDHLDHWVRQVRISPEGLMLVPMQQNGKMSGVQRTFLDSSGRKIKRMMLGPQGITPCPVPTSVLPHDLGIGTASLVSEGWETDAAVVQAAGWPGLSCQYDGGIVTWALEQAARAQGMTPDQLAKAPAPVILVDNDKSGAGQKAASRAVKILRKAGLRAYYAAPPTPENGGPRGGLKGSDWGDYPREGISDDVLLAHLKLAIATGDNDMPQINEDDLNKYTHLMPVRPARMPKKMNRGMGIEQARDFIKKATERFVMQAERWQEWQRRAAAAAADPDEEQDIGPEPTMPTLGLEITTGLGKSRAIKKLIAKLKRKMVGELEARSVPTVIVGQDRNACQEFEKAGAFWRRGRENSGNGFEDAWHCPKMEEGQQISLKEHFWGPTICSAGHCEHGNKRSKTKAEDAGHKISKTVLRFFRERPELEAQASDHCWLDHMQTATERFVIVVTAQGFGPADMITATGEKRIVIVDESAQWTHGHKLGTGDLGGYLDGIDRLIPLLEKEADGDDEAADEARKILKRLNLIRPLLQKSAESLGVHATTKKNWVDAPADLLELAEKIGKISDQHTQVWERPIWSRWTELVEAPLRATQEIIDGARHGSLAIRNGELLAVYQHPTIAEAIGKHPFMLADATLDPLARSAILGADGEILRIIADQGLTWISDPSRFRGAPKRDGNGRVIEEELQPEIDEMQDVFVKLKRPEKKMAIIAQKTKAIRLLSKISGIHLAKLKEMGDTATGKKKLWALSIEYGIGWWSWHHKAHDGWAGWDLIIWDQPAMPRLAIGEKWEEFRAVRIANGEAPANIPHFMESEEHWVENEWVCTGEYDQQSRAGLHEDPEIRAFIQQLMDAARMQAAGRVRGVNNADCRIYQLGGTPVASMPDHCIHVTYKRLSVRKTDSERKAQEHEASLHKLTKAATRVIAQGQSINRENLQAECRANGTTGVCPGGDKDLYSRGANPQVSQTAPRRDTYQEWFAQYAPLLCEHMQINGRRAKAIREMKEAQMKFGEKMIKEALKIAESIFSSVDCNTGEAAERAWDVIENDAYATESDLLAARMVLVSLGETEGLPPPW